MTVHFAAVPLWLIIGGVLGFVVFGYAAMMSWGYVIMGVFAGLSFAGVAAVTLGVGMQVAVWANIH